MNLRTTPARLLAMPLLASVLALAGPLPTATATPAAPSADPAALPELVVPGRPLPQPRTETLLAAGTKGFLHTTQDATFAWTAYDTGATTVVGAYDPGQTDPGLHGAGSDVTVDMDPRQPSKVWKLQDMASGSVTVLNTPDTASLRGVYGDAVLALTNSSASAGRSTVFLRADGKGGTSVLPVANGQDAGVEWGWTDYLGGDADEAALGTSVNGEYRIGLADTHTGAVRVSPPLPKPWGGDQICQALTAVDAAHIAWLGGDCKVHILSRADLNAPEKTIPVSYYDQPLALGLSGDWLLSVGRPPYDNHESAVPVERELKATPVGGGAPVSVLSHASPTIVQAPDGTALVEGGDTGADWTVRKVTAAGGAAPSTIPMNYKVMPESYRLDSLNLSANTLISAESGNSLGAGFYGQQVTLGSPSTMSARRSLGTTGFLDHSISCGGSDSCTDMKGTGDGRVVHLSIRGMIVRRGQEAREINLDTLPYREGIVVADGRFVLLDTSQYPGSSLAVLDIDSATPDTPIATASTAIGTIDGGRLLTPGSTPGEIVVRDLTTQQTRTLQTGKDCRITHLMSAGGWLYWDCSFDGPAGSAGLLRPDGTSRPIEVPARAVGMGNGFLVYAEFGAARSTVVDFHTGIPVTSSLKTRLSQSSLFNPWSVDRFGGGLVYGDSHQNLHLVNVISPGTTFHTVSPSRLLDTRDGTGRTGTDKVPGRSTVSVQVAGRGNVPAGAKAAVLNVTATETDGPGHLIAWASGSPQPTSSNLNWTTSGVTTPNLVIVPLGPNGKINLFNASPSTTHLIADVFGYYTDDATGSTFTPVSPDRLLDTRDAIGRTGTDKVPGRSTVSVQVAGRGNVPAGAKAAVLNVTATETDGPGHLIAWASGSPQPTSSNLNWTAPGVTTPNLVIVPLGPDGKINLFNASPSTTHLIADVFGYYTDDATGSTFTPVSPDRLLDTRDAIGRTGTDKVPGRSTVSVQVAGRGNVPAGAKAAVLNVTATETDGPGHLIAWASGSPQPTSSNLNWTTSGVTTPNLVVVPLDDAGRVMFFNGAWTGTHLIADVLGYYV
ncbi:hypothetical protein OG535_28305 [Kitasatospora sp. NBC_00085]|uniref:hypothetical protein n=1 Tax=Kitasatospora sp. NBC_00085 TaxID=2903566 RepID=UPI003246E7CD